MAHGLRMPRAINRGNVSEVVLLPLILVTALLFALGLVTGWHAKTQNDHALIYAAVGGMGMPVLSSASECRRPFGAASAPRLRHDDVLALLAAD